MTVPAPIWAERMHDGPRVDVHGASHFQQQIGFSDQQPGRPGDAVHPHQRRVAPADDDFQLQLVAGHDLTPELGVVHAPQEDLQPPSLALEQQDGGHLGERLDHQDAGHDRGAREMALEEVLVDGDVLVGHQTPARVVLHDGVEQVGRVALGQAVD